MNKKRFTCGDEKLGAYFRGTMTKGRSEARQLAHGKILTARTILNTSHYHPNPHAPNQRDPYCCTHACGPKARRIFKISVIFWALALSFFGCIKVAAKLAELKKSKPKKYKKAVCTLVNQGEHRDYTEFELLLVKWTKASYLRAALKRKWCGIRDKLTAVFEAAGVPTGVAKVNADILYSIVCDPKDFDLETDVRNPFLTFCGEEGVSAIDLLTPKMITAAGQREDDTWLNKSCSDWHSQNEAAARAKETINMTKMASENTASCICTASAGKPFQYEDPTGASNVLNCVTGLELPICTVKPYHLDTSLLAYPWRAHATFLTAFSGQAVILMYSAAALEEEPDIDKMVTTKKSKYFHNIYGFNVRKGESCWIPFGWTPMICPYEMSVMTAADEAPKEEGKTKKGKKKDEKNPKEEVFTYGLAPAYDETADARASVSLRRKVLNLWDAAEKMPASFNDNAKLQQWKKAITPEAKSLDDR